MKRILTFGVFDLLHKGHVELFRRAKALGDYLIVAVQDDEYIKLFKPESIIANSLSERMYMVESIKYVDEVTSYKTVADSINQIQFDILVHGPDQIHDGFQKCFNWCREHGKSIVTLERTEGISSTEIKAKINNTK